MLENAKNLKSHDKGNIFCVIYLTLDELGRDAANISVPRGEGPRVIDTRHFILQHCEGIVLVGFSRLLNVCEDFILRNISENFPARITTSASDAS